MSKNLAVGLPIIRPVGSVAIKNSNSYHCTMLPDVLLSSILSDTVANTFPKWLLNALSFKGLSYFFIDLRCEKSYFINSHRQFYKTKLSPHRFIVPTNQCYLNSDGSESGGIGRVKMIKNSLHYTLHSHQNAVV